MRLAIAELELEDTAVLIDLDNRLRSARELTLAHPMLLEAADVFGLRIAQ